MNNLESDITKLKQLETEQLEDIENFRKFMNEANDKAEANKASGFSMQSLKGSKWMLKLAKKQRKINVLLDNSELKPYSIMPAELVWALNCIDATFSIMRHPIKALKADHKYAKMENPPEHDARKFDHMIAAAMNVLAGLENSEYADSVFGDYTEFITF